ncbi:hypothetical protein BGW37DRAFT_469399 [Umbelopsis sp. PMI_123]|nr:hypothetical protein BGW37DRAFT_469399 [Umbelopsis sp. PMI_123]
MHNELLIDPKIKNMAPWGCVDFSGSPDIERVNLNESYWNTNAVHIILMAVCPKEKLLGQQIKKTVIIHSHSEIHLYPVAAFRAYVRRKARPAYVYAHPVLPHMQINHLIRSIT